MVFGDAPFGRCLGQEEEVLMNGIGVLIKETPKSQLSPSTVWDYIKKMAIMEEVFHWGSGLSPLATTWSWTTSLQKYGI